MKDMTRVKEKTSFYHMVSYVYLTITSEGNSLRDNRSLILLNSVLSLYVYEIRYCVKKKWNKIEDIVILSNPDCQ